MAFDLASLLGGTIGETVAKIVSLFKVDPTKQLEAQVELTKLQMELQGKILDQVSAQLDVNKVEAASTKTFVAGWRPFIGWICGVGLGTQFIVGPIVTYIALLCGKQANFPTLDLGTLMTLLLGMLGLGTMRSYEKVSGVPGTKGLQ